jgi:putative oxidoreductase
MNTTLLVLRVVPGLLLIGHGLQKLVPSSYSPPLLHANGLRATADGFEQMGIRPGVLAALLAGTAEVVGGFSLGAGLLTPVGTMLVAAVMTTAIVAVHARSGIWVTRGGFEYAFLILVLAFVISALGPGSFSINAWAHVSNWAGIDWSMSDVARAAIVTGIGAAAGLLTLLLGSATRLAPTGRGVPAAS